MSNISYFQRFSQKENHVTNNTLLVLRHFYQASPQKLEAILSELTDEVLSVGLDFEQQKKLSDSIPDAFISQSQLDIFFETKRGGDLDQNQIERHINSISQSIPNKSLKILFGLTKTPISLNIKNELKNLAKSQQITFIAVTFADIVQSLRSVCEPYEVSLCDILTDYEQYLIEEKLLQIGDMMAVVPCGASMNENIKHRLYFEPANRPSKSRSKFMGLYSQKCIKYMAPIITVVNGVMKNDEFEIFHTEKGNLSDEEQNRIIAAIQDCTYFAGFALDEHRYYLFDEVHKTEINKTSKGGIWGPRIFNLSDWLVYDDPTKEYTAQEAASSLIGKQFT